MKNIILILISLFWPIELILHNQNQAYELITYIAPAILIYLAYKYYDCKKTTTYLSILLIPVIAPKLTLFPLIFFLIEVTKSLYIGWIFTPSTRRLRKNSKIDLNNKSVKSFLIFVFLSMTLIIVNWKSFYGQTIFVPDYEAQQKVIRDQKLYPNSFTARLFHNKARIILDKFNDNFFVLIDPNNYFFGFAPRQIVGNQNLQKFPFLALTFFFLGLFYLFDNKDKYFDREKRIFLITTIISLLISLSVLSIFDRNDFVLYFPIVMLIVAGTKVFENTSKTWSKLYYLIFILFSAIELLRIFN